MAAAKCVKVDMECDQGCSFLGQLLLTNTKDSLFSNHLFIVVSPKNVSWVFRFLKKTMHCFIQNEKENLGIVVSF